MTDTIGLAKWLAKHVDAIAADEAAGDIFRDIENAIEAIERLINRPMPGKYCGNCPALTEDKQGREQTCAIPLYADYDHRARQYPVEIQCWKCKAVHNVDQLIHDALNRIAGLLYSAREVQELMASIGQPIPARTWRYWRAEGKIPTRGWRDGEPMYWIDDVRDLIAAKPQTAATGAAAKRRAS